MVRNPKDAVRSLWAAAALAAGLLAAACSPGEPVPGLTTPTLPAERTGRLTPFLSATPSPTAPLTTPTQPLPVPTPTPTPRTHEVKSGEDMFGIALRYGVTLEELMAANPTVQPNLMSVGTQLVIPPSSQPPPGEEETGEPPTPTPLPLDRGALSCSRSKEGGVWCFLPVQNNQSQPIEGITAIFRLADQAGQAVQPQTVTLPLDRLAPGARLPLAAYFPPPVPDPFQASIEVQSALPGPDDGRYLPVRLENQKVLLAENGLSAVIEVDVSLDAADSRARRLWLAAAAYDADGSVVGLRRWESNSDPALVSGQALPVRFEVYSVSGKIEQVELYGEARP